MVDFLANKFQDREAPKYLIREIDASYLDQKRARAKLRVFRTVEGSSTLGRVKVKKIMLDLYERSLCVGRDDFYRMSK